MPAAGPGQAKASERSPGLGAVTLEVCPPSPEGCPLSAPDGLGSLFLVCFSEGSSGNKLWMRLGCALTELLGNTHGAGARERPLPVPGIWPPLVPTVSPLQVTTRTSTPPASTPPTWGSCSGAVRTRSCQTGTSGPSARIAFSPELTSPSRGGETGGPAAPVDQKSVPQAPWCGEHEWEFCPRGVRSFRASWPALVLWAHSRPGLCTRDPAAWECLSSVVGPLRESHRCSWDPRGSDGQPEGTGGSTGSEKP